MSAIEPHKLEALLEKAKAGNIDAKGKLVEAHREVIAKACYGMIGHKEDSEDVAQKAIENLLKTDFPPDLHPSKLKSYIISTCRRAGVDHFRTQKNHNTFSNTISSLGEDLDSNPGMKEAYVAISRKAISEHFNKKAEEVAAEKRELVKEKLRTLPREYKEVIIASDYAGLKDIEIAEKLSLSIGTVKSRLHRARLALKKAVNGENVEETTPSLENVENPAESLKGKQIELELKRLERLPRKDYSKTDYSDLLTEFSKAESKLGLEAIMHLTKPYIETPMALLGEPSFSKMLDIHKELLRRNIPLSKAVNDMYKIHADPAKRKWTYQTHIIGRKPK